MDLMDAARYESLVLARNVLGLLVIVELVCLFWVLRRSNRFWRDAE